MFASCQLVIIVVIKITHLLHNEDRIFFYTIISMNKKFSSFYKELENTTFGNTVTMWQLENMAIMMHANIRNSCSTASFCRQLKTLFFFNL